MELKFCFDLLLQRLPGSFAIKVSLIVTPMVYDSDMNNGGFFFHYLLIF